MKDWKNFKLADIADIDRSMIGASQIKPGTIFIGLEHITSSGSFINVGTVDAGELASTKFMFDSNHILYGKLRPYLKKIARPRFDGVCSTDILPIRPQSGTDRDYLYYYLRQPHFIELATERCTGANLPRLSPDKLADFPVLLPSLNEQRRIAAILEKADAAREKRRQANQLTEQFLQSVFLEMFGDPATNPKGWKIGIIGDGIEYSEYGTSEKSNDEKRGYPVLGMGNITYDGQLDLSRISYVDLPVDGFEKLRLQKGDIIFNRTNSTELVGKTVCWNLDIDAVLASYLVKLRLIKDVNPFWLSQLLNTRYFKIMFMRRCKKAVGQSNISPSLLKEFPMYFPPISEQQKFAALVEKVESLRAKQRQSEQELEHLFHSLMQRVFRGELLRE